MSEVEQAMRYGPIALGEQARVDLLNRALAEAYNKALEEQALDFDRMMLEGDTEPLTPRAVAALLRKAKGKVTL